MEKHKQLKRSFHVLHSLHAIERTKAWMDGYRSLPSGLDTTVDSWKGFNYLTCMVIALNNILKEDNKG